jgi:DNA mismatch endonuclease, patch repair protein
MRKARNYSNRNFKKQRSKDKLSSHQRSERMSGIRSRDTKFEKEFIVDLKKKIKKSFETNVTSIKGKPDIVFKKDKVCVFLDSDFWHGWQYPRWKHLLKNDFWREKIEKNRKRDLLTTQYLKRKNWKVLRIWEHEIRKNLEKAIGKVIKILE